MTSGGRAQRFAYGGRGDYLIDIDTGNLGLWEGGHLDLRGETRLGQDCNEIDGAVALSNFAMALPRLNQNVTALTGVQYTQDPLGKPLGLLREAQHSGWDSGQLCQGPATQLFLERGDAIEPVPDLSDPQHSGGWLHGPGRSRAGVQFLSARYPLHPHDERILDVVLQWRGGLW